jgi:hypothetical protein
VFDKNTGNSKVAFDLVADGLIQKQTSQKVIDRLT